MTSPYTAEPLEALMAAQTSVGIVLGALLWLRRLRPWLAELLFGAAIALAVVAPVSATFLTGVGIAVGADHAKHLLEIAAGLALLGAVLTRRRLLATVAILGAAVLWPTTRYLPDSDRELAAAHLALFGLLVGVHWRTLSPAVPGAGEPEAPEPGWRDDLGAFLLGTAGGVLVCFVLLHGWTNSADEWANTYQAALFAKLRAYGSVPRCAEAFRSFWVFQHMGRSFAQYTPGWPYYMTPFVVLGVPWLAGPTSLGVLAAGVARLARRAARGFQSGTVAPSVGEVRMAGWFAALATVLGSTMLINGGSRYPHVFTAALYAWAVETLLVSATRGLAPRARWGWGIACGTTISLLLATRPGDGATLGVGLFAYFVYALARRRIDWRSLGGGAIAFVVVVGLTLVVLRLQLGKWFTTGYSLSPIIYPWNKMGFSLPKAHEYKSALGLPLATGSYCWWPCSPAVGLAGIAALRGRAQRLGFVFLLGFVPFAIFYTLIESGRGYDLGYGPRYALPYVVPMAVGTGVMLARLWSAACTKSADASPFHAGGPAAVAMLAVIVGVVRIAPLVYPHTYADVQVHNRMREAVARLAPHNAVVIGGKGLNNTDPMDLTENLPLELYRNQDILFAIDRGPESVQCVREEYPGRTFYRAIPGDPVRLVPF
jgi:hypothetical protein